MFLDSQKHTSFRENGYEYTYFPVLPSHNLTDLSKEQLAIVRVSGEKHTWLISCWWPVILLIGFESTSGCHIYNVKSSEPDTNFSGLEP